MPINIINDKQNINKSEGIEKQVEKYILADKA
jgi:hypothetical protein